VGVAKTRGYRFFYCVVLDAASALAVYCVKYFLSVQVPALRRARRPQQYTISFLRCARIPVVSPRPAQECNSPVLEYAKRSRPLTDCCRRISGQRLNANLIRFVKRRLVDSSLLEISRDLTAVMLDDIRGDSCNRVVQRSGRAAMVACDCLTATRDSGGSYRGPLRTLESGLSALMPSDTPTVHGWTRWELRLPCNRSSCGTRTSGPL
jgi:hypothetical protein